MSEPLKIAVCVPSGGDWKAAFGQAVSNMLIHFMESKYDGEKSIELISVGGSILPDVRHRLVAEAMKIDATHMLFLDDDMVFPKDALNMLLRWNVPIVGANYVRRGLPTFPTAYRGKRGDGAKGILWTQPGDNSLVEVKHVGTGCMLIDMRVFTWLDMRMKERAKEEGKSKREISKINALPLFQFLQNPKGPGFIGEDVYFCEKCIDLGLKIYCDQELSQEIGHVGELIHTHFMALEARDNADRDSAA